MPDISGGSLTGYNNAATTNLISDTSGSITTDASNGEYVAPFIASMYADASGEVGSLQQVAVTVYDIDRTFTKELTAADAKKILKAFKVEDQDTAETGVVNADASANVLVSMVNDASGDFKAALVSALAASDCTDASSTSLTNWLKAEARADTKALLSYDSLANLLEDGDFISFGIALDASGGAKDMWAKLSATDASGENKIAARRRALFTQIKKETVQAYATVSTDGSGAALEPIATLNFLPLLQGDKLAMIFNVTVGQYTVGGSAPTEGAKLTLKRADAGPGSSSVTDGYIGASDVADKYDATLLISKPTLRRVAVKLQMAAGGAAFPLAARAGNALSLA